MRIYISNWNNTRHLGCCSYLSLQLQQKMMTSLFSRSTATVCVDNAARAGKQFCNIARVSSLIGPLSCTHTTDFRLWGVLHNKRNKEQRTENKNFNLSEIIPQYMISNRLKFLFSVWPNHYFCFASSVSAQSTNRETQNMGRYS